MLDEGTVFRLVAMQALYASLIYLSVNRFGAHK